jgi:hypothetical protein
MKTTQLTQEHVKNSLGELKAKFDKISSQPATRDVKLLYSSCCGCGCSDVEVLRTVPYDSPINDGDRINKIRDTDQIL